MSIRHAFTRTFAATVAATALTFSGGTFADDDAAVGSVDLTSVSSSLVDQFRVPKTALKFEYPPQMIMDFARKGQFLDTPLINKRLDYEAFLGLSKKQRKAGKAGTYIGVVVDNSSIMPLNKRLKHARDVRAMVSDILLNKYKVVKVKDLTSEQFSSLSADQKKQEEIKVKTYSGLAERRGARVVAIIPIRFDPTDKKTDGHSVAVNSIIISMNDYALSVRKDGGFISNIDEAREWLVHAFMKGEHLKKRDEYYPLQSSKAFEGMASGTDSDTSSGDGDDGKQGTVGQAFPDNLIAGL